MHLWILHTVSSVALYIVLAAAQPPEWIMGHDHDLADTTTTNNTTTTMTTTTTTAAGPAPPGKKTSTPQPTFQPTSRGEAGVVVGAILGTLGILAILFVVMRRRRQHQRYKEGK